MDSGILNLSWPEPYVEHHCLSIPWEQFLAGSQPGCALWALLGGGYDTGCPQTASEVQQLFGPPVMAGLEFWFGV